MGGYINIADQTNFPVSTTMMGALVKFGPGGLRQLHWHTTLDEWQFVINGTFEVRRGPGYISFIDWQMHRHAMLCHEAKSQAVCTPCICVPAPLKVLPPSV